MADLFDNPMGLMGFEFIEFASPTPNVIEPVLEAMGFSKVAVHRSKAVTLYRQGDINAIVNSEPKSPAAYFAAEHGPSVCGFAFRVKDAQQAHARALELGAQPLEMHTGFMELRLPAIKGIGGAPLYLIDILKGNTVDNRRGQIRFIFFCMKNTNHFMLTDGFELCKTIVAFFIPDRH